MPTLEAVREDLETASDTLDQLRGALRQGENVIRMRTYSSCCVRLR